MAFAEHCIRIYWHIVVNLIRIFSNGKVWGYRTMFSLCTGRVLFFFNGRGGILLALASNLYLFALDIYCKRSLGTQGADLDLPVNFI